LPISWIQTEGSVFSDIQNVLNAVTEIINEIRQKLLSIRCAVSASKSSAIRKKISKAGRKDKLSKNVLLKLTDVNDDIIPESIKASIAINIGELNEIRFIQKIPPNIPPMLNIIIKIFEYKGKDRLIRYKITLYLPITKGMCIFSGAGILKVKG